MINETLINAKNVVCQDENDSLNEIVFASWVLAFFDSDRRWPWKLREQGVSETGQNVVGQWEEIEEEKNVGNDWLYFGIVVVDQ